MSLRLVVLLSLVLLLGTAYAVLRLLMRGKRRQSVFLTVDGEDYRGEYRYGSKLPKLLGHSGTTVGRVMCFRSYPPGMGITVLTAAGPLPPIGKLLAANELFHVTDRIRRGVVRYWARVVWQGLTIRRHDDRPFEQESTAAAPLIVAGTYAGVNVGTALEGFQ